jgi:taurine transport system permease protein
MSRSPRKALPGSWHVSLTTGFLIIVLWEVSVRLGGIKRVYLSPPSDVLVALWQLLQNGYAGTALSTQIGTSVCRVFSGYAIAVLTGIPIGLLMGKSQFVQRVIDPVLQTYRPIPPIAYIPLLIIWFGIGELPKVVLIFLAVFPVVCLNAFDGVGNISDTKMRAAYALGAKEWHIFWFIILPGSLPHIATGLRIGIGSAWMAVVAAEMIAADSGLGWMVLDASRYLRTDIVILGILIIGLIGFSLDLGFRLIEERLLPWRGKD